MGAEKRGKRQVLLRPCSKVIVKFLQVMMKNGYIGEFEVVDDHRAGKVVVNLNGRVNKCGVLSPRFDMQFKDNEKWSLTCSHLVNSGTSCSPLHRVSWITTRPSASRLVARFWDTSSRSCIKFKLGDAVVIKEA